MSPECSKQHLTPLPPHHPPPFDIIRWCVKGGRVEVGRGVVETPHMLLRSHIFVIVSAVTRWRCRLNAGEAKCTHAHTHAKTCVLWHGVCLHVAVNGVWAGVYVPRVVTRVCISVIVHVCMCTCVRVHVDLPTRVGHSGMKINRWHWPRHFQVICFVVLEREGQGWTCGLVWIPRSAVTSWMTACQSFPVSDGHHCALERLFICLFVCVLEFCIVRLLLLFCLSSLILIIITHSSNHRRYQLSHHMQIYIFYAFIFNISSPFII